MKVLLNRDFPEKSLSIWTHNFLRNYLSDENSGILFRTINSLQEYNLKNIIYEITDVKNNLQNRKNKKARKEVNRVKILKWTGTVSSK